jgi:citrate lyase subunit alpha/citrate CoA-transferase
VGIEEGGEEEMKNAIGREIPSYIEGYGRVKPFAGTEVQERCTTWIPTRVVPVGPGEHKLLGSIREAILACGLSDGMTISFHHCLRNGDGVLNLVLDEAARMGLKSLKVAMTGIFPVHAPLVEHIKNGVVTGIYTNYLAGPVARAVSNGVLKYPVIMHSHGGRVRAIVEGDLDIDVAFIAASACDEYGNMNGVEGKSAFGVMGYSHVDVRYARRTVAVTDCLVEYPACPIEINQQLVDYVVAVDSIGDARGIESGTTKVTEDPVGLKIASMAAGVIEASGLLKNGFSFQTGAGGTSLAVAAFVRDLMKKNSIRGSFASGGITAYIVGMLEEGLFRTLFDAQCFDLKAVESFRSDKRHQRMSIGMYGNPHNKGSVVNNLDVMILGATEIDTAFNANVTTGSNGILMGGSGGHNDTAAGAKLAIVVTKLAGKKYPSVVDSVTTATTPGETIDVLVTEGGIAVNPLREDLADRLKKTDLPVVPIGDLKKAADKIIGAWERPQFEDRLVAVVEYRDGTVIDVVRKVKTA